MIEKIIVSGFADEIDPQLDVQLKVVKELGMEYICLRAADGKGIADYTVEEFKESILPRLKARRVKVSSLGSPIGKIDIDDEAAYEKQLAQLDTLRTQQIGIIGGSGVKAGRETLLRKVEAFQKLLVNPKHNPLILPVVAAKHRLMQFHGTDQQHIAGSQQIAAVFNNILDISGQEEIHFIKVVMMERNLFQIGIFIPKNLKGCIMHSLPDFKPLVSGCHNIPRFPVIFDG